MKKKYTLFLLLTLSVSSLGAQETPSSVSQTTTTTTTTTTAKSLLSAFSRPDLSCKTILRYYAKDQSGVSSNSQFSVRSIRLFATGYCFKDFYYKLQAEVAGSPGEKDGPRFLDVCVEWQKWSYFKVKLGQFKRPFTFENPYSPWNVGMGSFSLLATKLGSLNDQNGEHISNGRDAGVQVQGDLFPGKTPGHYWFHYQVGLFNGQGTNESDRDNHKDLIGGLWLCPIKHLQIGAFGWAGTSVNDHYTGAANTLPKVDRNRWCVGLDYEDCWAFRTEYAASEGSCMTNTALGDKSDAWYATLGVPVTKSLKVYGRWDCYRANKQWNSLCNNYGLAANYKPMKDVMLQLNYAFTHDRSSAVDPNYNSLDFQVYFQF